MKDQNPYLHEFGKAWLKRFQKKTVSDEDHLIEAAREFGTLCVHGEKNGLPVPAAFELAREHFRRHGQAMITIADNITLKMVQQVSEERKR